MISPSPIHPSSHGLTKGCSPTVTAIGPPNPDWIVYSTV